MITINEFTIAPTFFPDKTSQVWKLEDELLDYIKKSSDISVNWKFESENEIIHIMQLMTLVSQINPDIRCTLSLPYLPYARQDKEVDNESTFALHTFLGLMAMSFDHLLVFDAHSTDLLTQYFGTAYTNQVPNGKIQSIITASGADIVCFPDKGASTRYEVGNIPTVTLGKTRDQLTGEITGMEVVDGENVTGKKVLIVDDLADGSRTFIESSILLFENGAEEVNLYVSHALFTKGLEVVHNSGISKIYSKDGLFSSV